MLQRFGFSKVPLGENQPSDTIQDTKLALNDSQSPPIDGSDHGSQVADLQSPVIQNVPDSVPDGAKTVPLRVVKVADKTFQSRLIYSNL